MKRPLYPVMILTLLLAACSASASTLEPTDPPLTDEPTEAISTSEPTESPTATHTPDPTDEATAAPTESPTPTATDAPEVSNCMPENRLKLHRWGRVLDDSESSNNVREEPDPDSPVIGYIPAGEVFFVVDGPECNGLTYWKVVYQGVEGWTAEGDGTSYWVEHFSDTTEIPVQTFEAGAGQPLEVSYQNISFTYPAQPDQPLKATVYNVLEVPWAAGRLAPETLPAHVEIRIEGIGWIYIFETLSLETFDNYLPPTVAQVAALLETRGDVKAGMGQPIPKVNAGTQFEARPQYIDFKNGSGFYLLTAYAQAIVPIKQTNYRFQGMTADGKYFIAGNFWLEAPFFDADGFTDEEWDGYIADHDSYKQYVANMVSLIEAAAPSDFTPNLDHINALFASMEVK